MGLMHKNTTAAGLSSPAAAAETAVYVTPVLQTGQGNGLVGVSGTIYVTIGTAGTAVTLRLRQGNGTGGTLVQALPAVTVTAGNLTAISFGFTDTLNTLEAVGGGQYTLTAQVTAATATSTVGGLDIEVIVLWHRQASWE